MASLKWSMVTKSEKNGRMSSILRSSHCCKNCIACWMSSFSRTTCFAANTNTPHHTPKYDSATFWNVKVTLCVLVRVFLYCCVYVYLFLCLILYVMYFYWYRVKIVINDNIERVTDFNLLKPNNIYIYIYRTAALTSRRYILNIYSTNIHTEYFKHAA